MAILPPALPGCSLSPRRYARWFGLLTRQYALTFLFCPGVAGLLDRSLSFLRYLTIMKSETLCRLSDSNVIYEDDVLIAVNKPAGLPSQGTLDPKRDNCYAAVQRYLAEKNAGEVYVGLHHRLDAMTSGVLLMTKSKAVNASISEQFQRHTIQKTYCAICCVPPGQPLDARLGEDWLGAQKPFVMDAPIGEAPGGKIQKFCVGGKNRKTAQTEITCESCLRLNDVCVLVCECKPLTGRTHQIRVHLRSLGMGIVGDTLYGEPLPRIMRSIDPHRMCLHAESLSFNHPVSGERMTICASRPAEFNQFLKRAAALGRQLRR